MLSEDVSLCRRLRRNPEPESRAQHWRPLLGAGGGGGGAVPGGGACTTQKAAPGASRLRLCLACVFPQTLSCGGECLMTSVSLL